jgi:type IV secretory pathway TraG/TraD family ATPase VirD4
MSRVVNTKESNLNFREFMDQGKILVVYLNENKLGKENVSLFGQLLINRINNAALSRNDIPENQRKGFYLIIDEFQNFTRGDISGTLSEMRKFGVTVIMANQTMAQLRSEVSDSVLGNTGNQIFFRPGVKDYEILRSYLEPTFRREFVLNLGNFSCIARLLVDNVPAEPFIFQTKL